MTEMLFYLIISFVLVEYVISRYLSYLNANSWKGELPDELKDLYDKNKYQEARIYHQTNRRFAFWSGLFSTILILALLFFDGFAWLDTYVRSFTTQPVAMALAFFGILFIVADILGLPFSIYSIFVIEEKFGFNKMTWRTFIGDKLKNYVLTAILGSGILTLLVFFYTWAGAWFWLYAWVALTTISLFFGAFATSIFLPLFNKLTPLETGDLRTAIEKYAQKVGFPLTNIFVMDGSKRSAKANAFFSGMGKKKSIVLFDTLVAEQSTDELVAVLAHEVGHYKKRHIYKGMAISIIQTGIMLFILGWALNNPALSAALGCEQSFHIGIIAFSLLYSPISMVTGVLMNIYSRKNEFEADAYARDTYEAAPLMSALKKLSVNHLSNLTPHPLYVFMYYSHPPLLQRLTALKTK